MVLRKGPDTLVAAPDGRAVDVLAGFIAGLIARRSQPLFVAQWASTGKLNGQVEEMHTGHAIVKVFGRQQEAIDAFNEENERLYQAAYRAQFITGIIQPALTFVSNLNYVAICVIGTVAANERVNIPHAATVIAITDANSTTVHHLGCMPLFRRSESMRYPERLKLPDWP